jgi:hypothetical protein
MGVIMADQAAGVRPSRTAVLEIGVAPLGATTNRDDIKIHQGAVWGDSPEMVPDCAPIPWAVWHTEQENPSC